MKLYFSTNESTDWYNRCEEFARQGCKVYATSRRVETIADFSNDSIEKLALDVTNDEKVQNALKFIVEKEGKIDVVVNNAGMSAPCISFSHVATVEKGHECVSRSSR